LNPQLEIDSHLQEEAPVNAIDLLEQQHREVKTLFNRYEKATALVEKRRLFEQIADDLAVHTAIEEKHFYPATRSARTQDLLQEAAEEHLQAKRIIADLLEMDVDDARFDAKMTVLREELDHHVEKEESELFPKVEKMLADDELEDLGVVMEDLAGELNEDGSPRDQMPAETGEAASI
jgi:hemerythrin superfamily protein